MVRSRLGPPTNQAAGRSLTRAQALKQWRGGSSTPCWLRWRSADPCSAAACFTLYPGGMNGVHLMKRVASAGMLLAPFPLGKRPCLEYAHLAAAAQHDQPLHHPQAPPYPAGGGATYYAAPEIVPVSLLTGGGSGRLPPPPGRAAAAGAPVIQELPQLDGSTHGGGGYLQHLTSGSDANLFGQLFPGGGGPGAAAAAGRSSESPRDQLPAPGRLDGSDMLPQLEAGLANGGAGGGYFPQSPRGRREGSAENNEVRGAGGWQRGKNCLLEARCAVPGSTLGRRCARGRARRSRLQADVPSALRMAAHPMPAAAAPALPQQPIRPANGAPHPAAAAGGSSADSGKRAVTLNVGGCTFLTTAATLAAADGSYFCKLAKQAGRAGGGRGAEFFIDRTGKVGARAGGSGSGWSCAAVRRCAPPMPLWRSPPAACPPPKQPCKLPPSRRCLSTFWTSCARAASQTPHPRRCRARSACWSCWHGELVLGAAAGFPAEGAAGGTPLPCLQSHPVCGCSATLSQEHRK